jgi:hypothetical protein
VFVFNALIKGEIEDLCGSRTGGWSLPGVMSDLQRCVGVGAGCDLTGDGASEEQV